MRAHFLVIIITAQVRGATRGSSSLVGVWCSATDAVQR